MRVKRHFQFKIALAGTAVGCMQRWWEMPKRDSWLCTPHFTFLVEGGVLSDNFRTFRRFILLAFLGLLPGPIGGQTRPAPGSPFAAGAEPWSVAGLM